MLGIDVDAQALQVYLQNHSHRAQTIDLSDTSRAADAIRAVGAIDLLAGSPPCQDFSSSGHRVEGTRASLTTCFASIAVSLRPRVVLIENVPQLLLSCAYREAKRVLVEAGYRVLELRVCAAACGVASVRRRVFVLAVRDCDPLLLQAIECEARDYNKVPHNAHTVRDCLGCATYFYPARNRHQPCVRSADKPAPTLTCNCLALPPLQYTARHDDAGTIGDARVLSVADAAALSSFAPGYFDGVPRSVAGRLIGNAVPPRMAAVVARWCARIINSPAIPSVDAVPPIVRSPPVVRRSRVERLVKVGLLSHGAVLGCEGLRYVCGTTGDALLESVLGWRPPTGWTLRLVERCNNSRSRVQAPLDDLYLCAPGVDQPFRSCRQALRWVNEHDNPLVPLKCASLTSSPA